MRKARELQMKKDMNAEKLTSLCSSLLHETPERYFPQLLEVIDWLDALSGQEVWIVRIVWGIRNRDMVYVRDCIQYGVISLV